MGDSPSPALPQARLMSHNGSLEYTYALPYQKRLKCTVIFHIKTPNYDNKDWGVMFCKSTETRTPQGVNALKSLPFSICTLLASVQSRIGPLLKKGRQCKSYR